MAPSVVATLVAPASVVPLVAQASVAPSAMLLAELVLASLVRLLVDSVVLSVPPRMVASVDTLVAKANSPLVVTVVLASPQAEANSTLVAPKVPLSLPEEANSMSVAPVVLASIPAEASLMSVVAVALPSLPAEANSPSAVAVAVPSIRAEANSLSVAKAAPSVVLSALRLPPSAPRAARLNSANSVVALLFQEACQAPLTPSAVRPLEDVRRLLLELTPLRAVLLELDKLLLKVRLKALVPLVLTASLTILSTPLPEDLVLLKLKVTPLVLLLSVPRDLLAKDNVVASRLVSVD